MKLCIVTPSLVGHLQRGTGVYADNLITHLQKFKELEIVVSNYEKIPNDVELIHFTYFDPFFLTLPFRRSRRAIVTVHDLIPLRFPDKFPRGIKGELKWRLQEFSLKNVNHIISDSETSANDICKFTGISKKRISVVYLGVEKIFFESISSETKYDIQKKYNLPEKFVLYVGDVNWNKNIAAVVVAAQQTQLPFVIISKTLKDQVLNDNAWNKSAKEAQEKITRCKNIQLIGYLEKKELLALYKMATVFLYPSFYEGFGLPVVEAFAAGCPVITTHGGSLAEIAGESAYIVDPSNQEQITQTVQTLYASNKLQQFYKEKGEKQAKKFVWEKTAIETLKIYKSVTNATS